MIGQTLGHYRIEGKLGEGGMGVVYKARDTHLDRLVAIKVLPPERVADPERKRRFVQEAKAASALNHPNIITIHDIASEGGCDFIVMEYVAGRTLEQLIGRKGLKLSETLKCGIQIADALAAAHAAGIIHRDLKPGNVMVTESGLVKVLDFGLAKLTEATVGEEAPTQTAEGAIVGTVAYMSPEQAQGQKVDARSDIFSFGSVLYEMATGRRAFQGDSMVSILAAILHLDPKPLTEIVQGAPPELQRIIARCLRKAPERRFHYMVDVKVALEELRDEIESGALTTGLMRPSDATVQPARRPKRWIVMAAAVGLLLAGAAAGLWLARPPSPAPAPALTRLTFDSGLTFEPAFSPDGKLVAYASDRGALSQPDGNLDIWVQQVAGGEATRLTHHSADDREPAFSPDGSKIAFRSERAAPSGSGGIYVVPAIGGNERLIAPQGRTPRFSPDGQWIAYWVGVAAGIDNFSAGLQTMYVVPSAGASPRQLQPDFMNGRNPIWTPDGKHLLFLGSRDGTEAGMDWWVAPLEGGAAVRTGAYAAFRRAGFLVGYFPSITPSHWLGGHVVFSARRGDATNLWRIPISPGAWQVAGALERVTSGTGLETQPSLAAGFQGVARVVFSSLTTNTHIWSLPLDASQARPAGDLKQLSNSADDRQPSISADGKTLVFCSNRTGNSDVWLKDLVSGRETALTATPANEDSPKVTFDGAKVAYNTVENQKWPVHVVSARGGVPEKVCDNCWSLWDWSTDGKRILFAVGDAALLVGVLDPASAKKVDFLKHPRYPLVQAHFSPDDRWIAVIAQVGPSPTQIFVVRNTGNVTPALNEWIPVTDGSTFDDKPRWAPDGKLIYFTSDRDGFRCIWAQRLDPATKQPLGAPLPLYHSHSARRSLQNTGVLPLEISVARDKIVFNMGEVTGNIWMTELKER
jgi:Tol biopolymer transport system component/predicted Ser/Thr protein kinase